MCTTCVPGARGGHKRTSDDMELKSWIVLWHHVGAGNRTHALCKSAFTDKSFLWP